jgi:PST family polysaccharide transporter
MNASRAGQIGQNFAWLIGDRLLRMGVGLVVLGAVARYLGAESFGSLRLAIDLAALFGPVATMSVEGIVVRELVSRPSREAAILGTAFALRATGGLLALCLATGAAWIGSDVTGKEGLALVVVVGMAFLPQSFEVIELWFQRHIRSKHTVAAKGVMVLLGAGVKLGLVAVGAPLYWFALAVVLDAVLAAAALQWVFRRHEGQLHVSEASWLEARRLVRESWPLVLSGILVALYVRCERLLVLDFLGRHAVGVYYASVTVTDMWNYLPILLLNSVYPVLVEARGRDPDRYQRRLQLTFDLVTGAGYAVAVAVGLTASLVIGLIFGVKYSEAGPILVIHACTAPLVFSGSVRAYYFLLESRTVYHTASAAIGIAVNVSSALWLLPRYGVVGAAMAAWLGYLSSGFLSSVLFAPLRPCATLQARAFLLPLRVLGFYESLRTEMQSWRSSNVENR